MILHDKVIEIATGEIGVIIAEASEQVQVKFKERTIYINRDKLRKCPNSLGK